MFFPVARVISRSDVNYLVGAHQLLTMRSGSDHDPAVGMVTVAKVRVDVLLKGQRAATTDDRDGPLPADTLDGLGPLVDRVELLGLMPTCGAFEDVERHLLDSDRLYGRPAAGWARCRGVGGVRGLVRVATVGKLLLLADSDAL